MRKYFYLVKITFQEYFVYRLNFILWRFRSFVFFLTLLFFWLAIYGNRSEFLGYQKAQMLAYVVGIAFLRSIVLASRSVDLTGQIRTGELTRIVLAPIDIFCYWLTRDFPDKLLNIFFTAIEIGIVLRVFGVPFYLPQSLISFLGFLFILGMAVLLYFFLSMALAITAFWTEEIWATRWLFGVIFLEFFAGAFFPIDVLPSWLAKIIYLTPFPYLVFFPLKIWLEQMSTMMVAKSIFICLLWLIFFYWLAKFLWQKGAKNYGAYGG
ncbi:MAG: ABC transporter permease [Patescibacteria group bacterium]